MPEPAPAPPKPLPQPAPKPPMAQRRGGIWSVLGVLLVGAIAIVAYQKYFTKPAEPEPTPKGNAPKHLILISIDTLRADHLGAYGYKRPISPTIDAIAAEGAVVERHYSCYPLTLPAHLTQFTGVSTLGHRVRDNLHHRLPDELRTLAESLKAGGLSTGAFVSAHTMKAGSGLERGFDVYDDATVRELQAGKLTISERKAAETLKLAGDWVAGRGSDSFFCFVHLFDPHAPYLEHNDLGLDLPADNTGRYDGEIAYTDRELGKFFKRLKDIGVYEDALIVITADHGEGLGEHGELTHGFYVYDTTTHIPLILRGRGVKPATRVTGITRNYDLAPTLLELMGAKDEALTKQFHGVSLVPMLSDPAKDLGLTAFIESHYAWLNANWAKLRALRTKDGLAQFSGDRAELVDGTGQTQDSSAKRGEDLVSARTEITRLMNAWVPPRKGTLQVREPVAGTPYYGEAAVAQSFEPESINDTHNLPSTLAMKEVLRAYQEAELAYDEQRFETCQDRLRTLIAAQPDFVMAHRLLAAVNQALVRNEWRTRGRAAAMALTREAANSLQVVARIASEQNQPEAALSARRNLLLLAIWLDDADLAKAGASAGDPRSVWLSLLGEYRLASQEARAEIALRADAIDLAAAFDAESAKYWAQVREAMKRGEELKLAPWEQ